MRIGISESAAVATTGGVAGLGSNAGGSARSDARGWSEGKLTVLERRLLSHAELDTRFGLFSSVLDARVLSHAKPGAQLGLFAAVADAYAHGAIADGARRGKGAIRGGASSSS